jgi:hypothetical protein
MIASTSAGNQVTAANFTDDLAKRSLRTKLVWVIYLGAVGVATFGWLAFIAYCALALFGY